jgi:peptide/nickel transport system ATP-binding protein
VDVFMNPLHPYTRALLACIPRAGVSKRETVLQSIVGVVPPPSALPTGCSFEPRCPYGEERSREEHPEFRRVNGNHSVRCHFAEQIATGTKSIDTSKVVRPPITVAEPGPPLLEAQDLQTYYRQKGGGLLGLGDKRYVKAVEDVDLQLHAGQTLGLVGESGSGKTTVAKTILGLEPATGGRIEFMGIDLRGTVDARARNTLKLLQMVFQNPDSTLNPTMKVGTAIGRSVSKLTDVGRRGVRHRVTELLDSVKLGERYYDRLPRQLSGGEKQRVAVARALAGNPNLIVADEPTSALDVSVQAAVLNLLLEIQAKNQTALILITHDLNVVLYLADWIAVMYLGHIVDYGPRSAFLTPPHHPYTEALLSAIPLPDPTIEKKKIRLEGSIPSALDPPAGCVFNTRCPRYIGEICHTDPKIHKLPDGQIIACHHDLEYLSSLEPVIEFSEATEVAP